MVDHVFLAYPSLVSLRLYTRRLLSRISRERIIEIFDRARSVRKELEIREFPVDIMKVASHVGAYVINMDIDADGYVFEIPKTVRKIKRKQYIIVVKRNSPLTRRRFVIAHEIGHIILGHIQNSPMLVQIDDGTLDGNLDERTIAMISTFELEANLFAGELLVPADKLFYLVKRAETNSLSELARLFGVSKHVVFVQSELLKLTPRLVP